jgi:chromosome segregation ATPase
VISFKDKRGRAYTCLTLKGDKYQPSGVLSGGAEDKSSGFLAQIINAQKKITEKRLAEQKFATEKVKLQNLESEKI